MSSYCDYYGEYQQFKWKQLPGGAPLPLAPGANPFYAGSQAPWGNSYMLLTDPVARKRAGVTKLDENMAEANRFIRPKF